MRGIMFKPWKHRAIRENPDREWQTRRLGRLQEINQSPNDYFWSGAYFYHEDGKELTIKPRYQVGEVVYIKEAHYRHGHYEGRHFVLSLIKGVLFDTPEITPISPSQVGWHKRSPLFMPACAARDFIKILGVGLGRLQEITEEDAVAEGCLGIATHKPYPRQYRDSFEALWDSTNPNYPWASNPWCFVYTLKLVPRPEGI